MTSRWDTPLAMLAPMSLAALAHAPALAGGFTNWDDPGYLLANPLTVDPLGGGALELATTPDIGYPIPVTVLAYAAQRAVFGLDPAGFHAVSLALHVAVVALVAALCRRLGARWIAAAGAAAVVAIHPVTAEPVAWVVGQKDLIATALVLAALIVHVGPAPAASDAPSEARTARWRAVCALGLVGLALLAKPSAAAAPVLLAGADWARGRALAPRVWIYAVALAMAAAVSVAATAGHTALGAGPAAEFGAHTIPEAAWALGLHARHLVWPDPLLARYFPPTGATLAVGAAVGVAVALAMCGGAVLAYRRGARAVAFGLLGALAAYAPASGVIPLSRGPADSYLYLPLALAAVAIARGIEPAIRARGRLVAAVVAVALAAALVVAARAQARTWRDAPTLWSQVAAAYPDDPRALMRLGDAYLFVRQPDTALVVYERIRDRHPEFTTSLLAHGDALELLGRVGEAERVLCDAARRAPAPIYLEHYAWFLVRAAVEPCDPAAARAALLHVEPLLSARGSRPVSLRRASALLRAVGEPEAAARVEARLAAIER